jgi:hypothetical protein
MRIATLENNDGSFEIYFMKLGSWEDLSRIVNILVNKNQCSIVEEKDMISDKDVVMKRENVVFTVRHHYMMGNYLYTTNPADVPILERLANNIISSIKTA